MRRGLGEPMGGMRWKRGITGPGGLEMIDERCGKLLAGKAFRHREVQAELAEWVEVTPRVWERRTKVWAPR